MKANREFVVGSLKVWRDARYFEIKQEVREEFMTPTVLHMRQCILAGYQEL